MKIKAIVLFVIVAAVAMISFSVFQKDSERRKQRAEQEQQAASEYARTDAARLKGQVKIGLDNYLGYYPLRSDRMQREMLNRGYQMGFLDDGADYAKRARMLAAGELDFAVFTVDSYILNAAPDFSGQIVMVISESKGADAIVAKKSIQTINDLTHVTATLGSPSHQFIKASIIDFGLHELKQNIRPATGSSAALEELLSGKTDAAVLWEPDISTALKNDDFEVLISTRNTSKLIVDVLVASDRVVNEEPEKLETLLESYFPVLRAYMQDPDGLSREFQKDAELSKDKADGIIESIAWMSLQENASRWFGIRSQRVPLPEFRIIETIDLTNEILLKFGDFSTSPLPEEGAFPLLSSRTLGKLNEQQVSGQPLNSDKSFFERLSPAQWRQLDPVASLKIDPIGFKPGTQEFSESALKELAAIETILKRYPRYRLRIEGHTSTQGDAVLNRQLSQDRADAIRLHLVDMFKVSPNRVRAQGFGSDRPLKRPPGQSFRAWLGQLPRVEFHLLEELY